MTEEAPPSDVPEFEGQLIADKYRVRGLIGTGGMGTVWEGVHEQLGTRVAIKFIKPQFASQPEARQHLWAWSRREPCRVKAPG